VREKAEGLVEVWGDLGLFLEEGSLVQVCVCTRVWGYEAVKVEVSSHTQLAFLCCL
jgi:hypothetical protein